MSIVGEINEHVLTLEGLSFTLPERLQAHEPPEARGLARDEVRLLVSDPEVDAIVHTTFTHFPEFLRAGDVLVVNSSATINAALPASRRSGERVELHLSQQLANGRWVVETRKPAPLGTEPWLTAAAGERLALPADGSATLLEPYDRNRVKAGDRLWIASLEVQGSLERYLDEHGSPIRYGYVPKPWPLAYYQTIFARERGSAEMPSAGRAFTRRMLQALEARGVAIVPILLHTGVASLEAHEPPYPEFFRVNAAAARAVNDARRTGGRIVAVGTTVVRALETAASPNGVVTAAEGWTDLVITPARGVHVVDALLTGFHEPRASHLAMLEALAGRQHLDIVYAAALQHEYLWHEFGDLHLIAPAHSQF